MTITPNIARETQADLTAEQRKAQTGIRKSNAGDWCAIKNGRLVDHFSGAGAKRLAAEAAGTWKELA